MARTNRVLCLILGGGRGTRLYPLTKSRSKPAVPIGGKYRLIDIPISNCVHSGLNRVYVLTQFNSMSLHQHILNSYKFDTFGGGFVEILAAQQTMDNESWYQGTADAVRRNITYIDRADVDLVMILSGDQLYRMDLAAMVRSHVETKADVSIAALTVDEKAAPGFGIMRINEAGRLVQFVEKPKSADLLATVRTDPAWMERFGVQARGRPYLASMGIYLFNRRLLVDLLRQHDDTDFGKELFPRLLGSERAIQTFLFDGYWEDIGTVGAFHQANIELTRPDPPFRFVEGERAIFTRPRFLPCSKISGATIKDSLIADGCVIGPGAVIENSVIGVRARIGEGAVVRNSYVIGADGYEPPESLVHNEMINRPRVGIGPGAVVENAIIDKNARIGRAARIVNEKGTIDGPDDEMAIVRDGVVVVPKYVSVPDGAVI